MPLDKYIFFPKKHKIMSKAFEEINYSFYRKPIKKNEICVSCKAINKLH